MSDEGGCSSSEIVKEQPSPLIVLEDHSSVWRTTVCEPVPSENEDENNNEDEEQSGESSLNKSMEDELIYETVGIDPNERRDSVDIVHELKGVIKKYRHKMMSLQNCNEILFHQLASLEEQNNEICNSRLHLEKEIIAIRDQFQRKLEEKDTEMEELKRMVTSLEEVRKKLEEQVICFQIEQQKLLDQLETSNSEILLLGAELKEYKEMEADLNRKLKDNCAITEAEMEQNSNLSALLREARDLVYSKEEEIKRIKKRMDFLKRELIEKDNETMGLKQILNLVDVEEVEEEGEEGKVNEDLLSMLNYPDSSLGDANSTVDTIETDEAVDCRANFDEFSSLESQLSSDGSYLPRTSTAINSDKFRRRRKTTKVVKAKKNQSWWDELQAECPEVAYAFPGWSPERTEQVHERLFSAFSSRLDESDKEFLTMSRGGEHTSNQSVSSSNVANRRSDLQWRVFDLVSQAHKSPSIIQRTPFLIYKLLNALTKDTLKLARFFWILSVDIPIRILILLLASFTNSK